MKNQQIIRQYRYVLILLALFIGMSSLQADTQLATLTVQTGDSQRLDTPISVTDPLISPDKSYYLIENTSAGKKHISCQVQSPSILWWVLNGTTKAQATRTFILMQAESTAQPSENYPTLTQSGAWCWFADPRAITYQGKHNRTYASWVTNKGDVVVGYYDHDTNDIKQHVIHEKLQFDDHSNPGLLIHPDGRLQVIYSAHTGKEMYFTTATAPESIDTWLPRKTINTNTAADWGYTYANPVQLKKENKIYLFWRGGGGKPTVSTSTDGQSWAKALRLIESDGVRPYVKVSTNNTDTIHFAFTDGHPRKEPNNNIYYMAYRNGAFYKADGSKIQDLDKLPIWPKQADKVYDAKSHNARAWIWDVAEDALGHPVIVYSSLPEETDHRYRYARWDGTQWIDNEICFAGKWFPQTPADKREPEPHYSGGIILNHTDPSIVYLSRPIDGVFEIEKCQTFDSGKTFTVEPITRNSKKNNIRPFVPRNSVAGGIEVLWMNGDYVHYTNYSTAVKFKLQATQPIQMACDNSALSLYQGDEQILQYHSTPVPLPKGADPLYKRSAFIHPLYAPGQMLLTDIQPPDHYHHYGIWMPWTKTEYDGQHVDFWNLKEGQGTVRFVEYKDQFTGPVFSGFKVYQKHIMFDKATKKDKVILDETWLVRVFNVGGQADGYRICDIISSQTCVAEKPLHQKEYRYGGFGFRGNRNWNNDTAIYLTSEGKNRKNGHATRARWCDLAGKDNGQWAGVTVMSHPDNFRHPEPVRIWPEGRMFFNFAPSQAGDWDMPPGKEFKFQYRLYTHDDKVVVGNAERIWNDFGHPPKVTLSKN